MTRAGSRVTAIATVIAALALWMAPQASAAITGSHVATPADPTFGIPPNGSSTPIVVSGTTTGGVGGSDQVDIVCTNADGSSVQHVEDGITIAPNGSFSVSDVLPGWFNLQACVLRAYPAGTTPADPSPFTGPVTMLGVQQLFTFGGGPTPHDYWVWAQQRAGAVDYYSVGSCGVCDAYLLNSNLDETTRTFFEGYLLDMRETNDSPTRSEIQVDGVDAYVPETADIINQGASGFPAFSFNVTQDPSNGDTTITESDQVVKCGTDTSYPPNPTKCASFVDTGVRLDRTIVQDHDGKLVTVTDNWVNTGGGAHTLDLLPQNEQLFYPDLLSADPSGVAYEFPGQGSYSTHAVGDVVDFGGGSPGAVFVKRQGSPDDATGDGQGAIVFDRPANPATFAVNATLVSSFHFHQTATVPASGTTTFRTAYAQAYTCAEVSSLAQTAANSFGGSVTVPCPPSSGGGDANPAPGPTGRRAAALKKCKKKHSAKARKKCRKKAKKLPV